MIEGLWKTSVIEYAKAEVILRYVFQLPTSFLLRVLHWKVEEESVTEAPMVETTYFERRWQSTQTNKQ